MSRQLLRKMRNWWTLQRQAPAVRHSRRTCSRVRPRLELLEDRMAPAVITVTTTADYALPGDGIVSLKEAIFAMNGGNILGNPDINAQSPGAFGTNDTIKFNIPGAGLH